MILWYIINVSIFHHVHFKYCYLINRLSISLVSKEKFFVYFVLFIIIIFTILLPLLLQQTTTITFFKSNLFFLHSYILGILKAFFFWICLIYIYDKSWRVILLMILWRIRWTMVILEEFFPHIQGITNKQMFLLGKEI